MFLKMPEAIPFYLHKKRGGTNYEGLLRSPVFDLDEGTSSFA